MLFCVCDVSTVDVWCKGQHPDKRVPFALREFLTFKMICDRIGQPLVEVKETELFVGD